MPRRINLLLVRHAVSEANLDKSVNARLPDHRVSLAPEGHEQARRAGEALAEWLSHSTDPQDKTRILCSPYHRTRQTSHGIEEALSRENISYSYREELALREISFGLFDGLEDDELPVVYPREHAHYQKHKDFEGEFYARMPMGESRIEVADRVKNVFGTIIRDNLPTITSPGIDNFIIVTHGVTLRTFIMQWLHFTPEWYEKQKNPANASITRIWSDGEHPYKMEQIFEGFPYDRETKQDKREEAEKIGKPDR